jgi:hypothetical protein
MVNEYIILLRRYGRERQMGDLGGGGRFLSVGS